MLYFLTNCTFMDLLLEFQFLTLFVFDAGSLLNLDSFNQIFLFKIQLVLN